jgi:multiple sugar transport system substrate-binding protein
MDELISVSSEEGASTLLEDMIPSVKADASYEDRVYIIPYSFENITFNWRNDYFAEVGITERPATWDDWYEAAVALKEWGADQEIFPTSFVGALWTDAGALIASALKEPYTTEGLLDWMAPESIGALEFYRRLVSEELTPAHGFDGWFESFQREKVASVQAQSSRGVWGQNLHGADKWTTSPIATMEEGGGAGTVYWGNGLGVVNTGPYPQEVVDFYVYAFGPANKDFQKAVIQSGKTPVYNSSYDEIIAVDSAFDAYKWMIGMRDDVTKSLPVPRNNFYLIQHNAYTKNIVTFIEDPNMTAEQLAQMIVDESMAEIDKQKVQ